ncbi:uncharacterized protein LOC126564418 [Anopheles maculipalpis]|uniref:uncharacterized protein LOC126564418 n=1 Tax=Anopheles maculipalpis TaxID=1496333 RepID=UPI002159A901|nr:uncharacterized protein LOC126564418 [Anopheles maculipalpis]
MGLGSSVEAALATCNIKPSFVPVSSQRHQFEVNSCNKQSNGAKQSDLLPTSVGQTMTNGTLFQPQYTEVFSSGMAMSTAPLGSGFVEFNTAHSNNWQSMEASVALTTHQRQSRPRHRHLIDSRLNNSFVDGGDAMVTSADACISDIRRVEENLRMESRMLSDNNNIPMARCSTPSPAYCFHCDHDHRERCCLYVGDTPDDGPYYSRWKRDLENPTVRPQYIPKIPEAVSGNSTPFWFPAYTYTKPEAIKQKMLEKNPPPPAVWMRQFYYPIVGYGHEYQLMNQATMERPTPYQQYLQQHQQDVYRLYHHQQQQQQQSACRHGRKCNGCSAGNPGTPYVQQQFHPHVNQLQVAGDYVQQQQPMHPQSAYYYQQSSYYSNDHHVNPPHHHQPLPQQHYVTPIGYAPVPVYHDAYLHPAHGYTLGYHPVGTIPPREPTPPSPTTPTSTPLWLLFCQKLSRKFPDRSKKPSPTKGRSPSKNFVHHHVRHNPTTVAPQPATITPVVAPDYYPPKYASIDQHPPMQYPSMAQPVQSYGRSVTVGQTVISHPPYYSQVPSPTATPMNDVGMYYLAPTAVNL